jgi:hypothetical protein
MIQDYEDQMHHLGRNNFQRTLNDRNIKWLSDYRQATTLRAHMFGLGLTATGLPTVRGRKRM